MMSHIIQHNVIISIIIFDKRNNLNYIKYKKIFTTFSKCIHRYSKKIVF